jgi:hypothetical protein
MALSHTWRQQQQQRANNVINLLNNFRQMSRCLPDVRGMYMPTDCCDSCHLSSALTQSAALHLPASYAPLYLLIIHKGLQRHPMYINHQVTRLMHAPWKQTLPVQTSSGGC